MLHPLIMLVVIPPINNMSLGYYVSCCLYCDAHATPVIVLEVLAFELVPLFIRTPTAVSKPGRPEPHLKPLTHTVRFRQELRRRRA